MSAAWLAPWARLAGRRGLFFGSAVALSLAALAAAASGRCAGAAAPWLIGLALAGSVAFHAPFRFGPWCVLAALVVGGLALARGRERGGGEGMPAVFDGEIGPPSAATLGRLALAGSLLGLAAADDPTLLPLLWPAVAFAAADRVRPARRIAATLAGAFAALAAALALAGAQWSAARPSLDPALFGWNLVDLAAGRHVGLLLWHLPLLALAGAASRAGGRSALPLAVALALALRLVLAPFDWAGSEVGPASLALLPLLAALWLWPGRAGSPLLPAAVAVAAGLLLWPLWLAPRAGVPDLAAGRGPARTLLGRLPVETALRRLPGVTEVEQAGVRVRAVGPVVRESVRGLEMAGDARAELTVASARRLTAVRLDFGGQAPVELVVEGAKAGNTTFRPGGAVAFDLLLDRPARRHPTAWSDTPVLFYPLSLRFPAGRPAPLPFALSLARPAVPEGGPPT